MTFAVPAPLLRRVVILVACLCGAGTASAQVAFTRLPDRVDVSIDGQPFTSFHVGGEHLNRVYLHPLRAASGTVVTRSVPAGQLPGETTDHPHHAGLFYGHGDVNGLNFWAIRNEPPSGTRDETLGRIVLQELTELQDGPRTGTLRAVLHWLTPDGRTLITERRAMTFHAHPQLRIVDVDIDLEAHERVVFGDTKEGTFALRVATVLEEADARRKAGGPARTGRLRNAQGGEGEPEVWGRRSEWVDYAGAIDGERVGIVMMDHPSNPRHPTYWHSRGYGLHAINPFGVHDFLDDPTKDGSLAIEQGQRVRFRYRVAVHPGWSAGQLADLYREFATAPGSGATVRR
jgi:hypothetical protein